MESVNAGKRLSEVSFSLFTDNNGIPRPSISDAITTRNGGGEKEGSRHRVHSGACAGSKPFSLNERNQERVTGVGERAIR